MADDAQQDRVFSFLRIQVTGGGLHALPFRRKKRPGVRLGVLAGARITIVRKDYEAVAGMGITAEISRALGRRPPTTPVRGLCTSTSPLPMAQSPGSGSGRSAQPVRRQRSSTG